MKKILFTAAVMFMFCGLSWSQEKKVSVNNMDISNAYQEFGTPLKNKSVTGEAMSVAGKPYDNGVGVHAGSLMRVRTDGKASKFTAKVGIADTKINYSDPSLSNTVLTSGGRVFFKKEGDTNQFVGVESGKTGKMEKGSVIFIVKVNGKEAYNSGVIKAGDAPKVIDIPLEKGRVIDLIVNDAGDGISGDRAVWISPEITYDGEDPVITGTEYKGEAEKLPASVEQNIKSKVAKLPKKDFSYEKTNYDWVLQPEKAVSEIYQSSNGKEIVITNGLVTRVFRITPNLATVDYINQMAGETMIRAVCNEGVLKIDGKEYELGGLSGQFEYGYTMRHWLDSMSVTPGTFRVVDFEIKPLEKHINWANGRWASVKNWDPKGKVITFTLQGPGVLNGVKAKVNFAVYDNIPVISKWIDIDNQSKEAINLDNFKIEQLAMVEPESPVEQQDPQRYIKYPLHVQSEWGFLGFTEREAEKAEFWEVDTRFTSQCNYALKTPCLLEIKLPFGPDMNIAPGGNLSTFKTWEMPFDSESRERKGIFQKRFYKVVSPWVTENPIFMHCTSTDPQVVKTAVDQCVETGYEMIILSFGSGLNMEDTSDENIAKFKELTEYANSKGIELGGYSLLASRWISDEVDVINPETGKRGGTIFGSSPCLCSEWGHEYFAKVKTFFEKTGMKVFEHDGSYPGSPCASTVHKHHKGFNDSQWLQRKKIEGLYKWMCENGVYINVPDFYVLSGTTKVGIGYREVNWSLPRERQLVLGRQVMYDGLWERLPSMCWTFVPLTQYHGGGAAATLEPLSEHLDAYVGHMMQNYGAGVQACYRGHRLYDTEETKQAVKGVIDWYKKYRDILNSELLHIRRADGKDYDAFMHANPFLKEKGLVMVFNSTKEKITRTIDVPMYYTGLLSEANIREKEGQSKKVKVDREYNAQVTVTIEPNSYTWLVIE